MTTMLPYLLKRLLWMMPTLLIISLITFLISTATPGDPVAQMLSGTNSGTVALQSPAYYQAYLRKRQELGLDKPVFYLTFSSAAQSDTLYRIADPLVRKAMKRLTFETGNWPAVSVYMTTLQQVLPTLQSPTLRQVLTPLVYNGRIADHEQAWATIDSLPTDNTAGLQPLRQAFLTCSLQRQEWRRWVPAIHWHGPDNRYHHWLTGLITGSAGTSYRTGLPVGHSILSALSTTLQLTLLAILLSYLIALPLGIFSAARQGSSQDLWIQSILMIGYALPVFWIGTLMIIFLGGGDYLDWFPPYGLGDTRYSSGWEAFLIRLHHLVLPITCLVYPTLAYLSRQSRAGMLQILSQDYIRTARAKGLTEQRVVWWHGFRNALLPVITLLAGVFPFAIGGSVVVEVVFSLPGMGKLTLDALQARDYPVVYAVVMLTALLTLTGYLLSDLLYARADPRIRIHTTRQP